MCYATGTCSPTQMEAISQLQPETSVSCHLGFTGDTVDFSANDVFRTHVGFDSSIGEAELNSGLKRTLCSESPAMFVLCANYGHFTESKHFTTCLIFTQSWCNFDSGQLTPLSQEGLFCGCCCTLLGKLHLKMCTKCYKMPHISPLLLSVFRYTVFKNVLLKKPTGMKIQFRLWSDAYTKISTLFR